MAFTRCVDADGKLYWQIPSVLSPWGFIGWQSLPAFSSSELFRLRLRLCIASIVSPYTLPYPLYSFVSFLFSSTRPPSYRLTVLPSYRLTIYLYLILPLPSWTLSLCPFFNSISYLRPFRFMCSLFPVFS